MLKIAHSQYPTRLDNVKAKLNWNCFNSENPKMPKMFTAQITPLLCETTKPNALGSKSYCR
jgi:hypothetical protein